MYNVIKTRLKIRHFCYYKHKAYTKLFFKLQNYILNVIFETA
jgi:hypothetical protein